MLKLHRYMKRYLHWQIIMPMLGLFVFFAILGVCLIYAYLQNDLRDRLLMRGELAAHSIQFAVESSSTISGIQRYVSSVGAEDDFSFVVVVVGEPAYVVASTEFKYIGESLDALPFKYFASYLMQVLTSRKSRYSFEYDDYDIFVYSTSVLISNITVDGRPLGKGALMLHLNITDLKASMVNTLVVMSTLFVVILLVLAAVLLMLIRYYVLLPQKNILSTICKRQVGEKSLAVVEGVNEFAQLSRAFNDMLKENDKIEQVKSEFVSTVSHELRTPLTSIHGSLGLVLGIYKNDIPDAAKKLLNVAAKNSERLTLLINDILDLEKIVAGRLEFDFKVIDLVSLAYQSLDANVAYAHDYKVQAMITESPQSAKIWGDENRIGQVFSNLLSNAIKFSNKEGKVDIRIQERGNLYRVNIKDYGCGIPDEFRSKVFQRFAQADSSDTRKRGGTGLGLNICKMIIESHNGRIDYVSSEGFGTEFFFDIPKYNYTKIKGV